MTGIDVDAPTPGGDPDLPDGSHDVAGATVDDVAPPPVVAHRFGDPEPGTVPDGRRDRRGRVSKWDRPPPPHDWRWWVGNVGKTLIAVGILMFGFVAYQLWGTGIENAAAQRALEDDFEELLAEFDTDPDDATVTVTTPDSEATTGEDATAGVAEGAGTPAAPNDADEQVPDEGPSDDGEATLDDDSVVVPLEQDPPAIDPVEVVPASEQNLPPVEDGGAIAKLEIPRIGVSDIVVAGIDRNDLKRGPGHFPDTPLPGQLGNAAIAGHRTTYGAPFFEVDQLENGDEIRVTTLNGVFVYRVTAQAIVSPSEYQVVATTDPTRATLTLVSCHPRYTARQRIIISAELDPHASGAVGEPVLNYGRPDEPDGPPAELPAGAEGDQVAEAADDGPLDQPDESAGGDSTTPSDSGSTTGSLTTVPSTADELVGAAVDDESVDVFSEGWFSDPGANLQVGAWGLALTAIAILSYLVSRRLRRDWAGLLVGVVPFVVALYFFFQNVNRLLPPNL